MSNCLQENRRARAGTNFFQELLSFCVWVGRNFPQMSSDISCYCTSPRSRQYTYPLPLGIKILYTKNIVKTVRFTVALHGGGMVASEGSLERVYSPWTKVWIISFIHSHKCIRKAPENENNAYVTAEIVYLHIYKIYFGSEISKWGPSAINREFGILDCWHAIRGAPRTNFRLKLGIWPRRGGGGSDPIPTFINHCFYGIFHPFLPKNFDKFTEKIPTFGEGGGQVGWAKFPTFTKKLFWGLP